jgi:hypothetical protein
MTPILLKTRERFSGFLTRCLPGLLAVLRLYDSAVEAPSSVPGSNRLTKKTEVSRALESSIYGFFNKNLPGILAILKAYTKTGKIIDETPKNVTRCLERYPDLKDAVSLINPLEFPEIYSFRDQAELCQKLSQLSPEVAKQFVTDLALVAKSQDYKLVDYVVGFYKKVSKNKPLRDTVNYFCSLEKITAVDPLLRIKTIIAFSKLTQDIRQKIKDIVQHFGTDLQPEALIFLVENPQKIKFYEQVIEGAGTSPAVKLKNLLAQYQDSAGASFEHFTIANCPKIATATLSLEKTGGLISLPKELTEKIETLSQENARKVVDSLVKNQTTAFHNLVKAVLLEGFEGKAIEVGKAIKIITESAGVAAEKLDEPQAIIKSYHPDGTIHTPEKEEKPTPTQPLQYTIVGAKRVRRSLGNLEINLVQEVNEALTRLDSHDSISLSRLEDHLTTFKDNHNFTRLLKEHLALYWKVVSNRHNSKTSELEKVLEQKPTYPDLEKALQKIVVS